MQFVVPQFIDIEPKIIGPISPRQLIILIITAGGIFLCWKLFSLVTFILVSLVILGLGITFAFVKVGGQDFHYFLLNLIQSYRLPQLRIWKKELIPVKQAKETEIKEPLPPSPKEPLKPKRLSELALIVDTGGAYNPEDEEEF